MSYIGFPPKVLTEEPLRLEVLYSDATMMVVQKPFGVLPDADDWFPKQRTLIQALQSQQALGKAELKPYNIQCLKSIFFLDPYIEGAAMVATKHEAAKTLRNAYGSDAFTFTFQMLTKNKADSDDFTCDLPMVPHESKPIMSVSHRFGKKATTHFKYVKPVGGCRLWTVTTHYLRPHLILLHAYESSLKILGESIYAGTQPVYLSKLKPHYMKRESETPLYPGPALYLSQVAWPHAEGETKSVEIPTPKKWQVLLKYLERYTS